MADYAKIAAETRERFNARASAAKEKLRQREVAKDFFKAVEAGLASELLKANPELKAHGLAVGRKSGGIAMPMKRFDSQIRLNYGQSAFSEVNYDESLMVISIEMQGEPEEGAVSMVHKLSFQVIPGGDGDSGATARRIIPDEELGAEYPAIVIAETVIGGLIRGFYEEANSASPAVIPEGFSGGH
jgi:hypothetical protein